MNCANHADASAVAYCRTCGKALCAICTRPVRGVIYCEDCLGAKMEGVPAGTAGFIPGTFAPGTFVPGTQVPGTSSATATGQFPPPPPVIGSGPNPTVAGILAGFFPFGVGAVYTGQYAKGLSHLAIFVLLIAGVHASDHDHSSALGAFCGLGIAFFIVYQIFDAVRSAKAIQTHQPIPDPFGLASTFSGGATIETSKVPIGAIVLILVGLLFLLNTMGLAEYGLDRFWPLILIAVGGWLFVRNFGLTGQRYSGCQCGRCRTRRLMGPAMVLTIGVLFLLENLDVMSFGRTWPVILLVVGAIKLLQGSASSEGHVPSLARDTYPGGPIPPVPPTPPVPPVPPSGEVNRG
jgi:hypothetical protein